MPSASNSSLSQPTPTPRLTRPPDMESSVPSDLANTTGLRWGRIKMPVPNRRVVVAVATHVSQISGSGSGVSGVIDIRPEGS